MIEGFMPDAKGRLVPVALVKEEHLLEDQLVREVHEKASALSARLSEFRLTTTAEILALVELLGEKYGAKRGGQHGNITLTTFDGKLRVMMAVSDQLELGPELQIAKDLVDACIRRWSEGASVELKAFVDGAFDVDKKGKLNTERILALRRLAIDEPDWLKAMEAIGDSVRVTSSKRYLRIYTRGAVDDKYVQVPLDIASA